MAMSAKRLVANDAAVVLPAVTAVATTAALMAAAALPVDTDNGKRWLLGAFGHRYSHAGCRTSRFESTLNDTKIEYESFLSGWPCW